MEAYKIDRYVDSLLSLVDGITNWYIRRSRRRFWTSGMNADKQSAYETLYYVIVNTAKLFAPVAPIISEKIYKLFTEERSVHLADWPVIPEQFKNDELVESIDLVQDVITLARSIRNKNRVKNRQPLSSMQIATSNARQLERIREFTSVIAEELNVKSVTLTEDVSAIATPIYNPSFNDIRALYPTMIPVIIKAVKSGKFRLEGDVAILNIDGEEQSFDARIIQVTYNANTGLFVANYKQIIVSLDLTITEELRAEGLAREIIRNVQDARKQIGCTIVEHIKLDLVSGSLSDEWLNFICSETLGEIAPVEDPATVIEISDDADTIKVAIGRM